MDACQENFRKSFQLPGFLSLLTPSPGYLHHEKENSTVMNVETIWPQLFAWASVSMKCMLECLEIWTAFLKYIGTAPQSSSMSQDSWS